MGTVVDMSATLTQHHWEQATEHVLEVAAYIGRGGAYTTFMVDHSDPKGLSPIAIRRLVHNHVAEMTAPPATAGPPDLERLEAPDGLVRTRCPIWTEQGRSKLAMDLVLWWPQPDDDFDTPDTYIEQLIDTTTGKTMLTEADAPASDDPRRGDQIPGTGEDPRIRRNAQIDDTILIGQVCGRIEQALGSPKIDTTGLTEGQHAIVALVQGYGEAQEWSTYTFIEEHPDWVHHMIWAARHIGAEAHAGHLDHALDVVANHAWNDPDREELGCGIDDIENGTSLNDVMVSFIYTHPDEFFR